MNALKELRDQLAAPREPWGVGTVTADHGVNLTVELENGASRRVFGSAEVGARVLIRGDRIMAGLDVGDEVVVWV